MTPTDAPPENPSQPDVPQMNPPAESRVKRWSRVFLHFATGQASIQLIGLLTGFFLLRAMSVEAFAQYSSAFAFQTTLMLLVDMGFSGSIIALVGDRGHEPITIGNYIRVARHYRVRMFIVLAVISAVGFRFLTTKQPWEFGVKVGLWIAIVSAVFFQGNMMYSAPLLIHRRLKEFYKAQAVPASIRLVTALILGFARVLTGWAAAIIGSATIALQGYMYRHSAQPLIDEPEAPDQEIMREMRTYVAPMWPGLIYFAFQGQITVGLISYFGKSNNIAEVAALGKLGQFFVFLGAMNAVLIEPYVAQLHRKLLLKRYILIATGAVAIGALVTILAREFPGPFLYLLGHKYSSLRPFIWITILSSSIGYVSTVLLVMNTARKWIFWPSTIASMIVVFTVQVITLLKLDPSTTRSMVLFGLTMPCAGLVVIAATGVYGYIRTGKQVENAESEEEDGP